MSIWQSFDPESREFLVKVFRTVGDLSMTDVYPAPCRTIDEAHEFRGRCADLADTIEATP